MPLIHSSRLRPPAPSAFMLAAMKIHSAYAIPGEGVVSSFRSTTTHILIGLNDGKIHVFGTNGDHVHTFLEPTGSVWALEAFENTLLNGAKDGSVRVWDITSGFVFKARLSAPGNKDLATMVT